MRPARRSSLRKYGLAAVLSCAFAVASSLVEATPATQNPAPAKTAKTAKTAKKGTPPATDTKATKPAEASKAAPKMLPPDQFWEQPEQKKVWELDHLTTEDEAQLGADINRAILHDNLHHLLKTGPLPRRLESAAEPYLKSGSRPEVNYTLTVLDCDFSNVFSTPGGYIYVCRGTFDWIDDEEDYVLEFMILHEMAHVDLAHPITNMRDPNVKKLNLGTVPLFYSVAIPWGNLEAQELEADKWAYERMKKQGRSRYQIQAYLRKLEDYSKKNGFENFPLKPTDGFEVNPRPTDPPRVPPLDNHLRSHPVPYKRMKALKALIDSAPKSRADAK
jgi:Peptidase family M48